MISPSGKDPDKIIRGFRETLEYEMRQLGLRAT